MARIMNTPYIVANGFTCIQQILPCLELQTRDCFICVNILAKGVDGVAKHLGLMPLGYTDW